MTFLRTKEICDLLEVIAMVSSKIEISSRSFWVLSPYCYFAVTSLTTDWRYCFFKLLFGCIKYGIPVVIVTVGNIFKTLIIAALWIMMWGKTIKPWTRRGLLPHQKVGKRILYVCVFVYVRVREREMELNVGFKFLRGRNLCLQAW